MTAYITSPSDIADARAGTGRLNDKEVLLVGSDMRSATKRIFTALAGNPELAVVTGLGLSVKSMTGQWRKIGLVEFKKLILDKFVLAREETGTDGRCRLRILSDVPHNFWLVSIMQGRWLTDDVQALFPKIGQPKIKIITRP